MRYPRTMLLGGKLLWVFNPGKMPPGINVKMFNLACFFEELGDYLRRDWLGAKMLRRYSW